MKTIQIPHTDLVSSKIALGNMRIFQMSVEEVEKLVGTSLDLGINFFDHADIYGGGYCEELFGKVFERNPSWRDKMILQSKNAIVPGKRYDASYEHILEQVDTSLSRLKTDHLDVVLLHRPDVLSDPHEIARAFQDLKQSGKVRYFGVSNYNVHQMLLLQSALKEPLITNQIQLSIVHCPTIDAGFHVNMKDSFANDRDGGLLEFCQQKQILVQDWSVFQASWEEGSFLDHPSYDKLNEKLAALANQYGVTKAAIALAWLLRLPGYHMPITGTTSVQHLTELSKAVDVHLNAQEWYDLYLTKENPLP